MHSQTAEESERQTAGPLEGAFLREHASPLLKQTVKGFQQIHFPSSQAHGLQRTAVDATGDAVDKERSVWRQRASDAHGPSVPVPESCQLGPNWRRGNKRRGNAGPPVFPAAAARRRSALASPGGVAGRPVPAHDWPDEECVPTAKSESGCG